MSRNPRNPIMKSIPNDVIREILLRSAVKDLLRFRCVSEFFKSVIDNPEFGKLHLSLSQKTNTNFYGIFDLNECRNPQIMLLDDCKSVDRVNRPRKQVWFVGSCNGLIAFENGISIGNNINIWNPMTGKLKKIGFRLPPYSQTSYGFGYDPESDDYKLVWILEPHIYSDNMKTAVYSMKTNSWKEIGKNGCLSPEFAACNLFETSVVVSNALHWGLCYHGGDDEDYLEIVAFDFCKEEFHHVPLLDCLKKHKVSFGVLDGCLTLSFDDQNGTFVWVMKEYGIKESWTRLLYLGRSFGEDRRCLGNACNVIPLAYSRDGGKVLLNRQGSVRCDLFWYDLFTGEVDDVSSYNGGMETFVGSLVGFNESADMVDLKTRFCRPRKKKKKDLRCR